MQEENSSHSKKPKLKLSTLAGKGKYLKQAEKATPDTGSHSNETAKPLFEPVECFNEKYQLLEKIGQGANGIVYRCVQRKSKKIYAVKKSRCDIQKMTRVRASYNCAKRLNHSNIIRHKGLYLNPQKRVSYLVMEYFAHPELREVKIASRREVAQIAYQLLDAIAYMHSEGACHRDIKPENILYDQKHKKIKITDFGECKETMRGRVVKQMLTCTGTSFYKAPQLFRGGVYDDMIDEWAAGVTIYELLTGHRPFDSEYSAKTIQNIESSKVQFPQDFWNEHPEMWAKQLIQQLLSPRQTRLTAQKSLKSLWFEGHSTNFASIVLMKHVSFKNKYDSLNGSAQLKKNQQGGKHLQKWKAQSIFGTNKVIQSDEFVEDESDYSDGQQRNGKDKDDKKVPTAPSDCKSPLEKEGQEDKGTLFNEKEKNHAKPPPKTYLDF